MKKLLLAMPLIALACVSFAQQWDMGMGFNFSKPIGGMATNIDHGLGVSFEGAYVLKNAPFSLGAEFSYNGYGHDKTRQQYTFDDGSVTETNVIVTNSYSNLMGTGKFFLRKNKLISPYFSAKLGYSWYRTTLRIEDPEDADGCQPLEQDHLVKDGTFAVSGGAGVRVDFSSIFRKMKSNTVFFDINAHMTQGGTVRYMNVDKPVSHQNHDSDVVARFINNRTQVIHEHHVGYIYNSLVEMMEYRLGVVYRPSR